jgi:soluble lytic murein transglycosylase
LVLAGTALADKGLSGIATLVRAGQHGQALAEIAQLPEQTRQADQVRYLEGRLSLEQGRHCEAMALLARTPAGLPAAIRSDSARLWAQAAAQCGACEQARPALLSSLPADASAARQDRALAAQCAIELGQLQTAASELEALIAQNPSWPRRVSLLAQLSDLYVQLDQPERARETALRAWVEGARPKYDALSKTLEPRALPADEDRVSRAEALMGARRFEEAVSLLEGIEPDGELTARWHHVYGMALFRMRTRYEDAARILAESAKLDGKLAVSDEFHAARALSRADRDPEAIRAYRRFAASHPKSSRAAEARYLAAWLEIRLGRKNGEREMARLVQGPSRVWGRWYRAALWQLGFRAFETKRYALAIRHLTRYADAAKSSMDKAQALYWLGRSYRRGSKAVAAYRAAIEVEPLHWYAVLSADRLRRLKVRPPSPFASKGAEPLEAADAAAAISLPETYLVYQAMGLDADAVRWLRENERDLLAPRPASERRPLLASLYLETGAYPEALRVARQNVRPLYQDPAEEPWWWRAAYPMPWLDAVDRHRGELPRALVYATMRQESGFRSDVLSRAGAIGLMQLMPELASKLAGEPVSRQELLSPERNIELGLQEMMALAEAFDGVYPLSIAAYNAGTKRVRRWLSESKRMELDRFVERIPFTETRNYVRRVSSHYARYAYLDRLSDVGSSAGKAGRSRRDSPWPKLPRYVSP